MCMCACVRRGVCVRVCVGPCAFLCACVQLYTNLCDGQGVVGADDEGVGCGAQFQGGVVVISHDSQLLSRVCDNAEQSEVWLVEDGRVTKYQGYFEDYKESLIKEIAAEMDEDEAASKPSDAGASSSEAYVNPLISNPALLRKA